MPLVAISAAVLVVGLSGGNRTAREPAVDLARQRVAQPIVVEPLPTPTTAWLPPPAPEAIDKAQPPAQASPGGQVLRIMGPPLVIEVRMPRTKSHVAKR